MVDTLKIGNIAYNETIVAAAKKADTDIVAFAESAEGQKYKASKTDENKNVSAEFKDDSSSDSSGEVRAFLESFIKASQDFLGAAIGTVVGLVVDSVMPEGTTKVKLEKTKDALSKATANKEAAKEAKDTAEKALKENLGEQKAALSTGLETFKEDARKERDTIIADNNTVIENANTQLETLKALRGKEDAPADLEKQIQNLEKTIEEAREAVKEARSKCDAEIQKLNDEAKATEGEITDIYTQAYNEAVAKYDVAEKAETVAQQVVDDLQVKLEEEEKAAQAKGIKKGANGEMTSNLEGVPKDLNENDKILLEHLSAADGWLHGTKDENGKGIKDVDSVRTGDKTLDKNEILTFLNKLAGADGTIDISKINKWKTDNLNNHGEALKNMSDQETLDCIMHIFGEAYGDKIKFNATAAPAVSPAPETMSSSDKKSNDAIALEVVRGNWGNGAERKAALTAAGYDYSAVQSIVNSMVGVTSAPASTDAATKAAPASTDAATKAGSVSSEDGNKSTFAELTTEVIDGGRTRIWKDPDGKQVYEETRKNGKFEGLTEERIDGGRTKIWKTPDGKQVFETYRNGSYKSSSSSSSAQSSTAADKPVDIASETPAELKKDAANAIAKLPESYSKDTLNKQLNSITEKLNKEKITKDEAKSQFANIVAEAEKAQTRLTELVKEQAKETVKAWYKSQGIDLVEAYKSGGESSVEGPISVVNSFQSTLKEYNKQFGNGFLNIDSSSDKVLKDIQKRVKNLQGSIDNYLNVHTANLNYITSEMQELIDDYKTHNDKWNSK